MCVVGSRCETLKTGVISHYLSFMVAERPATIREEASVKTIGMVLEEKLDRTALGSSNIDAEAELENEPSTDERINRALADAVELHATKDPRVRGILKRASVVRRPESESQKRNALFVSHTGNHRRQVCDPAPLHAPTRAPARATQLEQAVRNTSMATSRWEETVRTITVRDTQTRQD